MDREFESDDEGKRVVTADGDEVGTVETVSGSTAHVKPEGDLSQSVRQRLGWADDDEDVYELESTNVEGVENDRMILSEGS